MNLWILTAAGLSFVTLLIHLFSGGPEVHDPILESDLSVLLKAYGSVLWHAVTVVLAVNSMALLIAARGRALQKPLVLLTAGQYFGFAVLFGIYGLTRLGTLLPMPQWIIFCLIAAVALMGLRRNTAEFTRRVPA